MGLQARNVVRFAKKNGITMGTGGRSKKSSKDFTHCALGVVAHMANMEYVRDGVPSLGLTYEDIDALENGFEGFQSIEAAKGWSNRYFKVGRNIARILGLD